MEQRRLRLGDILDDYCPRERRVTNHAIVAMIGDDVKQTRCTTCDAEHPYKGGKEPRKRKKDTTGALYREVLAGLDTEAAPVLAAPVREDAAALPEDAPPAPSDDLLGAAPDEPAVESGGDGGSGEAEEGPVHRRLIRATLPRPDGQKEARPLPEFTIRSTGGRGPGGTRGARGRGGHHRPAGGGGQRFAGSRGNARGPAGRQGQGGFRPHQQPRHGGRKRSR